MDTQNNLRAIDISGFGMTLRGSLATPDGGGQLFVTSGIAYIAAVSNFRGGYDTVSVSNPDALTLISVCQFQSDERCARQHGHRPQRIGARRLDRYTLAFRDRSASISWDLSDPH